MSLPLISIVVPVYNSEKYVYQTLHSILNQKYSNFELIIINDGSTDKSKSIIETVVDDRIKYIENETNQGIVYCRNLGLQLAEGKYFAMVDSDDIVYPEKFEKQVTFLELNKEFGLIGSWVKFIDKNGKKLPGGWKLKANPLKIPCIMLFNNYFVQSSVLSRLEYIRRFTFETNFPTAQDYRMWVEISSRYQTWNIQEYLLDYRIHREGITEKYHNLRGTMEKEIFRVQLNRMGIFPTDYELDLHLIIKDHGKIRDTQLLMDIEQWLIKILNVNERKGTYNSDMLTKVIFNRWLKVCNRALKLNVKMLKMLIRSKITFQYLAVFSNHN